MHQWHGYDELYENLAQWLKETEGKVRSESGLRPDLDSKQFQRDTFKVVNKNVLRIQGLFQYFFFIKRFTYLSNRCAYSVNYPRLIQLNSQLFQRIQEDVVAHQETMDNVLKQAKEISEKSSDTRTRQYATQLKTRFDTLAGNVQVCKSKKLMFHYTLPQRNSCI